MASAVLPVAVGPTTVTSSLSHDRAARSPCSTTDATFEFVISDTRDDGTSVRTVTREIDVVERPQERTCLFAREQIPGSNAAVAGHRREHEVRCVAEGAPGGAGELGDQLPHEPLRFGPGEQSRNRVHGDSRGPYRA